MTWPPTDPAWQPRSLAVDTDVAHGGRWTSLRTVAPHREWLWRHPDENLAVARAAVRPGAAFVDAGGVEECFPTVRGEPDHGDAWSRPWSGSEREHDVRAGGMQLSRRLHDDGPVTVTYTVTGPAGAPFVHAVHALLDVTPAARLHAPGVTTVHLLDHRSAGAVAVAPWPAGNGTSAHPLDHLGPEDGTATAAVLPGCAAAAVVDGADALSLTWRVLSGSSTCSLLLWRNLGGWPAGGPYRSIGVEPMVGSAASLGDPAPGVPASIGHDGTFRWELAVTAWKLR